MPRRSVRCRAGMLSPPSCQSRPIGPRGPSGFSLRLLSSCTVSIISHSGLWRWMYSREASNVAIGRYSALVAQGGRAGIRRTRGGYRVMLVRKVLVRKVRICTFICGVGVMGTATMYTEKRLQRGCHPINKRSRRASETYSYMSVAHRVYITPALYHVCNDALCRPGQLPAVCEFGTGFWDLSHSSHTWHQRHRAARSCDLEIINL